MRSTYAHGPVEFRGIRTQVHERTALIHIDAGSHVRITIPEELLVGAVEYIKPQRTFGLGVSLFLTEMIGELRHRHILKLMLLLKLAVICHSVLV